MAIRSWKASVLTAAVMFAGSTLMQACAGDLSDERTTGAPKKHRTTGGSGGDGDKDGGAFGNPNGPAMAAGDGSIMQMIGGPTVITSMRIEPENATLEVQAGKVGKLKYKVFAKLEGGDDEVDISDRTAFYVPDNWRVGGFDKGGPTFATSTKEPRGGVLTVQATAANSDKTTHMIQTALTVHYTSAPKDPRDDGSNTFKLPSDPGALFDNAKADDSRAPVLVYPNDGVVLPPNLHRLSVHFRPGSADNTLYEIRFVSSAADVSYYARCGELVDGGCVLEMDVASFQMLADSNRTGQPIKLSVRGTDDKGSKVGTSQEFTLSFSSTDLRGAIYYWKTDEPNGIMRFDFGAAKGDPEPFLLDDDTRLSRPKCVGCHALSRDGTKIIAAQDGQWSGYQVFINNLMRDPMATDFITRNGDDQNRLQFASFSPKGDRVAAVYGDDNDGAPNPNTLWMLDGDTGVRLPDESIELPWEPDHPEWSPDGTMIALTRVGIHQTSQRPWHCGLEVLNKDPKGPNKGWSDPVTVVPAGDGVSRYNPSFVPDSSFFVFNESTCPNGDLMSEDCDADHDPTAKTWAVEPKAGATPVLLARVAQGGVEDQAGVDLSDTFPRSAPFESEVANDVEFKAGKLFWITVASLRRAGLYNAQGNRLLWMFAVDPAKILKGEDGSYPPFYVPFQDLNTSNHIAQWTQQIVTDTPPPPPPDPPAPPPPPPPPIPE
jgi:hypothetical protein